VRSSDPTTTTVPWLMVLMASTVTAVSVVPSMVTVSLTSGVRPTAVVEHAVELLVDPEPDERAGGVLVAELADRRVDGPRAGDPGARPERGRGRLDELPSGALQVHGVGGAAAAAVGTGSSVGGGWRSWGDVVAATCE